MYHSCRFLCIKVAPVPLFRSVFSGSQQNVWGSFTQTSPWLSPFYYFVCIRYIGLLLYSLDVITLTLTEKTSLALLPMILTHSIIVTYFFVIKHFVCVVGKLVCRCKVHICVMARGHVGCFLQLFPTSFWKRICLS